MTNDTADNYPIDNYPIDNERFGAIIHWGLYSLPARGEWYQHVAQIDEVEYQRYFDLFDADLFEPERWVDAITEAGMGYAIVTAKHHDGFCLWDSAHTDFKITNTPTRRDAFDELYHAFSRRGVPVGAYYSLLDWHHPDFLINDLHPLRERHDRGARNSRKVFARYVDYVSAQVTELIRGYDLAMLRLDVNYLHDPRSAERPWDGVGGHDWKLEHLLDVVREHAPDLLVSDESVLEGRDLSMSYDWFARRGKRVRIDGFDSVNGRFGYVTSEATWKTAAHLVRDLIDTVSRGGNLLVGIGPTGRGTIDATTLRLLDDLGAWMRLHQPAIRGANRCTEFAAPSGTRYTQRGNRLYVHLLDYSPGELVLAGLGERLRYAQFVHDASQVDFVVPEQPHPSAGAAVLTLPVRVPATLVPVVELIVGPE